MELVDFIHRHANIFFYTDPGGGSVERTRDSRRYYTLIMYRMGFVFVPDAFTLSVFCVE